MIDRGKRFAEVNNAHLDLYHFHFIIIRNSLNIYHVKTIFTSKSFKYQDSI